jgi:hypothetical protein
MARVSGPDGRPSRAAAGAQGADSRSSATGGAGGHAADDTPFPGAKASAKRIAPKVVLWARCEPSSRSGLIW